MGPPINIHIYIYIFPIGYSLLAIPDRYSPKGDVGHPVASIARRQLWVLPLGSRGPRSHSPPERHHSHCLRRSLGPRRLTTPALLPFHHRQSYARPPVAWIAGLPGALVVRLGRSASCLMICAKMILHSACSTWAWLSLPCQTKQAVRKMCASPPSQIRSLVIWVSFWA